jgi:hypothetical protein
MEDFYRRNNTIDGALCEMFLAAAKNLDPKKNGLMSECVPCSG